MKRLAILLNFFSALLVFVQWSQIAYRLTLFYRDYGGERYVNHVGDDVFIIIHVVNVALLIVGVFSIWVFWEASVAWRWIIVGIAGSNALAWLTLIYLHATGMLVGYDEFISKWKGL
ncbi:MAG: hypothetical protein JSS02_10195 [Planctomycetes bacterium]|nr:hypothetical protein [Planctomycetota bacterium]